MEYSDKKELDYLNILRALRELPFSVGKNLLAAFLTGDSGNESIKRNRLYKLDSFGGMAYSKDELNSMIENLILNNLIEQASVNGNKFAKALVLTQKGIDEIDNPSLYKKKLGFMAQFKNTVITEQDKRHFEAFDFFLNGFDDCQKKAVLSANSRILCIAGAGSGKTTALSKRIEFLIKFRSVEPESILAVTFTRKARREMESRLSILGCSTNVETFNSFCEKILKRYNDLVYSKNARLIGYRDKIRLLGIALSPLNIGMQDALDKYFSIHQRRGKTNEELANIFMHDCFFILDYCKSKSLELRDFSENCDSSEQRANAKMIYLICRNIDDYMKRHSLRDYTDQIMDTLNLFKKSASTIPLFSHVLIDEYQDVNSTQIELIELLSPKNIFCVGDPRQSIFGWRGSNIKYILDFSRKYPECETIILSKNYRSSAKIVELINKSIKEMRLPDLESSIANENGNSCIAMKSFDTEDEEFDFVIDKIIESNVERKEIFVLARTNRQLVELSNRMKLRSVRHVIRSEELRKYAEASSEEVTLSTVHAIKGLEAKMIFIVGCSPLNFPCKAGEHPVVELVKIDEYDKEEEERRLFYVAMSRARETIYMTYSGSKHTRFINDEMKGIIGDVQPKLIKISSVVKTNNFSAELFSRLKEWRKELCKAHNIPPYLVFHDRTLIELSQIRPASIEELQQIHGFGPVKIMRYGKEVLDIVNS